MEDETADISSSPTTRTAGKDHMTMTESATEQRLRRRAHRSNLSVHKTSDPMYGPFYVVDPRLHNAIVRRGLHLEDLEDSIDECTDGVMSGT